MTFPSDTFAGWTLIRYLKKKGIVLDNYLTETSEKKVRQWKHDRALNISK